MPVSDPERSQFDSFDWAEGFRSDEFELNRDSGEIFVAEQALLSFADQDEYFVEVTATDNGSPALSSTKSIRIRLIDENNPPQIQDLELSVAENSPAGTVLGTISIFDPDIDQGHVFGIACGDGADVFVVDRVTGEIRVAVGYRFPVGHIDPSVHSYRRGCQRASGCGGVSRVFDRQRCGCGNCADGGLPDWIDFDPASGLLPANPWNGHQGTHHLILTATDDGVPALSVDLPISLMVA